MITMRRVLILSCWLLLIGANWAAQPSKRQYCSTAHSQLELNRCWADEAGKADERLAAALKKALEQSPAHADAERAEEKWIEYREAQCTAVASLYQGGSMESMQRSSCLVRLTDQRIEELRKLVPESR